MRFLFVVLAIVMVALGADTVATYALPKVTPELKKESYDFYNNECKGCHRWARKFAAPAMSENVAQYKNNGRGLVKYLMDPKPIHPDQWSPMEIPPLTEVQAQRLASWLLYLLDNPNDETRPK
ncbi:MAG: hypothetical protein HUK21_05210 [Fibrobacteraceae bacterium]|nr:hypothetical protein [Fibrobacteraceae bacterium]